MRVSIDSRTVQPGDYFIPVKGPNFDGRQFINDAVQKGARLLDVDLTEYAKKYRKKLSCHVIGITGSAGKTTAKDMLKAVLGQSFNVVATKENQNNEVGVPLTLLSADESTDILIVEMGMRAKGEISHLTRLVRPTHVVVTGIGLTHASQFKSARDIAVAKAEIFQKALPWERARRFAFVNVSSNYPDLIQKKALSKGYSVWPYKGQDKPEQNVHLCYVVGRHFGLSDEQVAKGLSMYKPSAHRLVKLPHSKVTLIDDTYNANPDGVAYALQSLKRYKGRKILILADMLELGAYSRKAHQDLVDVMVDAQVDLAMTYGNETKQMISKDVPILHFDTKEALHSVIKDELKQGDVVLVKGSRSMKMEETVEFIQQYVV